MTAPVMVGEPGRPTAAPVFRTAFACDLRNLCRERGWSHGKMRRELRRVAAARGLALPSDDCLKVMVSRWVNGKGGISEFYATLLSEVFGCRILPGKPLTAAPQDLAEVGQQIERLTTELARLQGLLGQVRGEAAR